MPSTPARIIIDKEAEKQKKSLTDTTICPRCGENRLNSVRVRNALSRVNNTTVICDPCGTDEALQEVLPVGLKSTESDWYIVKLMLED